MDLLLTAVAVSMLSGSRSRISAAFKTLRQREPDARLERVLEVLEVPPHDVLHVAAASRVSAEDALTRGAALGAGVLPWFDDRYPALLGCIADPPPVLWTLGEPAVTGRPAVAIVGSRAATPYALEVGARLAAELAARGIAVVSGLARGVDSAAHRGSLGGGGPTVAVLGSGLDRVYPAEHKGLAAQIASNGCVITELGPGAPPCQEHFPLRNRIISGISLAVVVVEASEKSGSLITARCGLDQGRDVMAVPGNVLSGRNRGSHGLLKDGAKVVESADDILEELGWPAARGQRAAPDKLLKRDPLLAHMEAGESYRLDDLVLSTGMCASQLLTRLTQLELQGHVAVVGVGRFSLAAEFGRAPLG